MPLIWRELLRRYTRPFTLSLFAFISLLLVIRFESIAKFIAEGASKSALFWFVIYQFASILPLAIAISSLIASFLVLQRMSLDSELTALRSAGCSLFSLLFPLLLTGFLLSLAVLSIVAEVAPRCRANTKKLTYQIIAENPLCVLQRGSLIKSRDCFVDIRKAGQKKVEQTTLIFPHSSSERLHLIMAEKMNVRGKKIFGKKMALVTSLQEGGEEDYDPLLIENQTTVEGQASLFAAYLTGNVGPTKEKRVTLRMLRAAPDPQGGAKREIMKRLSLVLAACTFTILGASHGMEKVRQRSIKNLCQTILLVGCYFICFVMARSFRKDPLIMGGLFFLPHVLIILFSLRKLYKVREGI